MILAWLFVVDVLLLSSFVGLDYRGRYRRL